MFALRSEHTYLKRDLERGDLDLALLERSRPAKRAASRLARKRALGHQQGSPDRRQSRLRTPDRFSRGLPLPRAAIHALESAGRSWHMAYSSSGLAGIQAAVAAGLGLSILADMAIQADHRMLTAKDSFKPIDRTEAALVASPNASAATLRLADRLAEFCDAVQAKAA